MDVKEQKPASFGKTPQVSLTVPQVVAPDPHPPTIKNPALPVAATLVADPMLIPPDARNLNYGMRTPRALIHLRVRALVMAWEQAPAAVWAR